MADELERARHNASIWRAEHDHLRRALIEALDDLRDHHGVENAITERLRELAR